MREVRFLITRWIIGVAAYLATVLGMVAAEPTALSPDNAELLLLVAARHDANLGQIRTWRGRVVATTERSHMSAEASASSHRDDATVVFVLDRTRGWRRSDYSDTKCLEIVNGVEKDAPIREIGIMVKDETHYEYFRYPPQADFTVRAVDRSSPTGFSEVNGREVTGMTVIHSAAMAPPNKGRDEDFDPLQRMAGVGLDVAERFRVYYPSAKEGKEIPGVTIGREGELVTLKLERRGNVNRYTVDLGKGGHLVAFDSMEGPNGPTHKWRSEPQCVAGVWISKHTTSERVSQGNRFLCRLEWVENVINEPIPEDEFTLVKLGMHRGDGVEDTRTGTKYTVTGDEFPPPEDQTAAYGLVRSSKWVMLLIINGIVLALLATIFVWRRVRTSREVSA